MITLNGWTSRVAAAAVRQLWRFTIPVSLLFLAVVPGGIPSAKAQTAGDSLYAILWNGDDVGTNAFYHDIEFMYTTLIDDFGYTEENIIVLCHDGRAYDLDGDGKTDDIDFKATRVNADTVFARLSRVVTDGDIFFFYATDHGDFVDPDTTHAILETYEGDRIWEDNLVDFIDRLDTQSRKITKILVLTPCFSGGMIPELGALDYPVIIATASKEKENSIYDPAPCPDSVLSCDHNSYSYHWMRAMHGSDLDGTQAADADYNDDNYVTLQEAARFATANDDFAKKNSSPKESPRYWDTDCIIGNYMLPNGKLSAIPGLVVFMRDCHEPPPCRWGSWRCGGGGMWPSSGGTALARRGQGEFGVTLWVDPAPAAGETTYVYTRVRNPGDTPLTNAQVRFYFSDPTLSLIYPQSGLVTIGTEIVPSLAPHDSVLVGPVPFVPPPGGNSFGEPYWTVMAIAEHYESPVETGWLTDDDHVAASNHFELRAYPGEPRTIHLTAQNALDVPVKALVSVDADNLPVGWTFMMNPEVGDTIELDPNSSTPVEVTIMGIQGPVREGFVDITMALNTTTVKKCGSCDDACGGYIGDAGGCSIKLVLEGTVAVFVPELTVSASALSITLNWETSAEQTGLAFNVYRAEKEVGEFEKLNDTPIMGSGHLSFVDETAAPGKTYSYAIGVLDGGTERLSAPVEASLSESLELRLSQIYPNPFNPMTTIVFTLPDRAHVALSIYDIQGRPVRVLVDEVLNAGVKEYEWDGKNSTGNQVGSGVYFCRLAVGDRTLTKKMVLLK